MTPTHALLAVGALIVAGGIALAWAMCKIAGDTDDRDGRPRG